MIADLQMQTVRSVVGEAARRLTESGSETPALDARLLAEKALGLDAAGLIRAGTDGVTARALGDLDDLVSRRANREPIARILGHREFYGRRFRVTADVLDPRPETELIVDAALEALRAGAGSRNPKILDLGTGSGAILVSILAEFPAATGIGIDLDPAAVSIASDNARNIGVSDRCAFAAMDWDSAIGDEFDIIVSNPPYLTARELALAPPEVAQFDPAMALDGGTDGLRSYQSVVASAGRRLTSREGLLIVEIGSTQAEAVVEIMTDAGLDCDPAHDVRQDLAGHDRMVRGRRRKAGFL